MFIFLLILIRQYIYNRFSYILLSHTQILFILDCNFNVVQFLNNLPNVPASLRHPSSTLYHIAPYRIYSLFTSVISNSPRPDNRSATWHGLLGTSISLTGSSAELLPVKFAMPVAITLLFFTFYSEELSIFKYF